MQTVKVTKMFEKGEEGESMAVVGKFFSYLMGWLGMLFGVVLCLTIILIPAGLLTISGAKTFFRLAKGEKRTNCPNCQAKNYVQMDQQVFECEKCKEKINVEWEVIGTA